MALAIVSLTVRLRIFSIRLGRNTASQTSGLQIISKPVHIVSLVSKDRNAFWGLVDEQRSKEAVVPIAWAEEEMDDPSLVIDEGVDLGIRPTFARSNVLTLRAFRASVTMLMNLATR